MILLVSWLDIPFSNTDGDYQVVEFFAGVGRVAALSKKYGYKSCALDISYGQDRFQSANKRSPLDINSDAGLVPLVCTRKTNCLIIFEGLNLFSIFIVTEYTHIITGQIHPAAAACVAARWTRNMDRAYMAMPHLFSLFISGFRGLRFTCIAGLQSCSRPDSTTEFAHGLECMGQKLQSQSAYGATAYSLRSSKGLVSCYPYAKSMLTCQPMGSV